MDEANHAWTYADIETTARHLACIGVLRLLRRGRQGRRIVSEQWIDSSGSRRAALRHEADGLDDGDRA